MSMLLDAATHPQSALGRVDPRTKLAALIIINGILMGRTPSLIVLVVAPVTIALLTREKPTAALTTAGLIGLGGIVIVASHHTEQAWLATAGFIGYWIVRFTVATQFAMWVWLTTPVGQFIAALHTMRFPAALVIPLAVVFRFIPVVIAEARGIHDAMALRGYTGARMFTHPIATGTRLLVPLLTSTARIADELSAAALIRGLGAPGTPTPMYRLRFGAWDAALVSWVAGIVAAAFAL